MPNNLKVTSPAFVDNGFIPVKFTGQGANISPPLIIENISGSVKLIAIIMDDPDAPTGVFTHWLIWNIPAGITMIPEGIPNEAVVYSLGGALQGTNDFGKLGYGGPLPPIGQLHTYRIKVYALDAFLPLIAGIGKLTLENGLIGHIVQFGIIRGKYVLQNYGMQAYLKKLY
jgi:Raf kinase inhibitor-like YbhB/YbcL family protein